MSRYVVVGDLMTDVVARAMAPLSMGADTPAWVESYGGGSAANVAAWLGVQGLDVAYVGRRGPDVVGRTREMELLGYGIDPHVTMDQNRPTGTRVVVVGEQGERTLLPDPGANAALAPEDVPAEVFENGGHLHLSGSQLFHDSSLDGALTALLYATERGLTVSVDAVSSAYLQRIGPDRFFSHTIGATLLFANRDEAAYLTGETEPVAAGQALTKHFPHVVVKVGVDGVLWCPADQAPVHVAAEPVRVVDSSGAGDAFSAGLLAQWHGGGSFTDALAAGCALAAKVLVQPGARPTD